MALALFFALIREAGPQRALVITFVNPAVAVLLGRAAAGRAVHPRHRDRPAAGAGRLRAGHPAQRACGRTPSETPRRSTGRRSADLSVPARLASPTWNPSGRAAPGRTARRSTSTYHDEEWGTPLHGDDALFERLCLEAFQSGLSWITILRKRPAFRAAFAGFAIDAVAAFTADDEARLMADAGIVRNRAKISAAVRNARAAQELPEGLSGAALVVRAGRARPRPATLADVPATSPESVAMAKELKRRGFVFVGPTTAYALMQATGMVDDHVADCFRAQPGAEPARGSCWTTAPSYGIIGPEHSIDGRRTRLLPRRCGAAGEGGTHGGHEAAHG